MRAVRFAALLALVSVGLAGCGGSSSPSSLTGASPTRSLSTQASPATAPSLRAARARTTAAGPVQFKLTITADFAGTKITAEENGTASFTRRRAHLYKQIPGSTVPQELVLIGPYTYTNANVQAALADPTVKPWTKLDTRRLTAKQRRTQPDELAHVLAPAYLADGVITSKRGAATDGATRFTARVDPARLAKRVPASILTAVRNDYAAKPFNATFWLDAKGRVLRVLVAYATPKGSRITVDTTYSAFGSAVDVGLPAQGDIADISP
jgi:hypothetical protein